jgi:hypothetical protein
MQAIMGILAWQGNTHSNSNKFILLSMKGIFCWSPHRTLFWGCKLLIRVIKATIISSIVRSIWPIRDWFRHLAFHIMAHQSFSKRKINMNLAEHKKNKLMLSKIWSRRLNLILREDIVKILSPLEAAMQTSMKCSLSSRTWALVGETRGILRPLIPFRVLLTCLTLLLLGSIWMITRIARIIRIGYPGKLKLGLKKHLLISCMLTMQVKTQLW